MTDSKPGQARLPSDALSVRPRSSVEELNRDGFIRSVRAFLDIVKGISDRRDGASGKYGPIRNVLGVKSIVTPDPFDGPLNFNYVEVEEPGVYFYVDERTGVRRFALNSFSDGTYEVTDNPMELRVNEPELGYSGSTTTTLVCVKHTNADGTYIGTFVTADGGTRVFSYEGDVHKSRPENPNFIDTKRMWVVVQRECSAALSLDIGRSNTL